MAAIAAFFLALLSGAASGIAQRFLTPPPAPDLGVPRIARQAVGEALRAFYLMGAADMAPLAFTLGIGAALLTVWVGRSARRFFDQLGEAVRRVADRFAPLPPPGPPRC
jgi:hypothetical protein